MLNFFPQFLTYSFFAPTILRVAAAIVFAYVAYRHFKNKDAIAHVRFPVVGSGAWIPWVAVIVEGAMALALFFGYYTQIAAIAGAVLGLKYFVWRGKYPEYFVLSRSTCTLLIAICLSLLTTGAGALAFDLPL